jgi:hypothetical protein
MRDETIVSLFLTSALNRRECYLRITTSLPPEKAPPLPTEQEVGWGLSESEIFVSRKKNYLFLADSRFAIPWLNSP